ncbi:hypothetical protein GCM10027290_66630 [Micromonospora sonneratiae]|uniref:TY-Chap N-terminal domain-containing protein n=1 Tax=Micromonospora sonneratiae TaxID=1184706 RepID=A0ABW3YPM3_9ACTN
MTGEMAWDDLTNRLTDLLGRLPDGTVLQLHELARPIDGYFVQLWQRPDRLFAEVSGALTVDGDRRFPVEQENMLRELGWHPPTPEHAGHWWSELAWPAPAAGYTDLAAALVRVLRDVLGTARPGELGYQAWNAGDGRRFLLDLGLDQIEIRYYARVAPGDTPERPTGLLRRVRTGAVDHDEALGRDGHWRPTETLELADLGELDDELVPIGAVAADRVVTWWRELVDRETRSEADRTDQELIRPRLAEAVDAERDAQGRPVVRGPRLSEQDRSAVATYLRTAPLVLVAYGFDQDPFDPEHPEVVPLHFRTDGEWVWSESLAYFAQRYGIAPEADFMAYLARRQYRLPEVDDAAIARAAELLKG